MNDEDITEGGVLDRIRKENENTKLFVYKISIYLIDAFEKALNDSKVGKFLWEPNMNDYIECDIHDFNGNIVRAYKHISMQLNSQPNPDSIINKKPVVVQSVGPSSGGTNSKFYQLTNGAIIDNIFMYLTNFQLYENGDLVKKGPFVRSDEDDDIDITLYLRDDGLELQCIGLEGFNIRNHNHLTIEKSGAFEQVKGESYVATLLLKNNHYSVNPGYVPYKIMIVTHKETIYSISLYFNIDGVERELELMGKSDYFDRYGNSYSKKTSTQPY